MPASSARAWRNRAGRVVDIRPGELPAVLWSWLFFFCVLSAYYVIRPIRDDMGVAGGVENLPWLFTGSLLGTLAINVPFSWLVSRVPRRAFVSVSYRFFGVNLLIFFALLHFGSLAHEVWTGRAFFIWTSIFNLFVNALFWSVMADVFSNEQSKRLFGFIGVGGQVGAIVGAGMTSTLVSALGPATLLLLAAALLEVAALAARRLFRLRPAQRDDSPMSAFEPIIGGTVWEGFRRAVASPYFVNISLHMLFFTVLTTFLYFQQATLVDATFIDRVERTQFFANVDFSVNVLTLLTQFFLTARVVNVFGLTPALAFLPVLSVLGFITLGLAPTIAVLMGFQILRRAGNFAIARPAREVVFTTVSRADRYKVKTFIDTFVYRAGDQIGAWSYAPLGAMGMGVTGISMVAAVIAVVSIANAVWIGRKTDGGRH